MAKNATRWNERLRKTLLSGAGAAMLVLCLAVLAGCGGTPAEQAEEDAGAAAGQDAAAGMTTENMDSVVSFQELAVEYLGTDEDAKDGSQLVRVTGEVLNNGEDILGWIVPPDITLSATYATSSGESTTQDITAKMSKLTGEEDTDESLSFIYDALWNLQPAESRAFAATYSVMLPEGAGDPTFTVSGYETGTEQAMTVPQYDEEHPGQTGDVTYLLAEPAMFEGSVSEGAAQESGAPTGVFTIKNTTDGAASNVVGLYLTKLPDGNYYYTVRPFGDVEAGQSVEQTGSLPPASGGAADTFLNAVFYTTE